MHLRLKILTALLSLVSACATTPPPSGVLAKTCAATPIRESDVTQFGFNPAPGQIVVMRVFATWCPFCKTDVGRMATLYKTGDWSPTKVKLFLMAYKNRREDQKSFEEFRNERLPAYQFPQDAVQLVYVNQSFEELKKAKSAKGPELFSGWQGVPFGLVFGQDGRLAYRGHFTTSDLAEDEHYKFITQIQNENCSPPPP